MVRAALSGEIATDWLPDWPERHTLEFLGG
jgi:hypothetical protein